MNDIFTAVKMIVFDVDGTLTDGGVHLGPNGEEFKRFHIADGLGFRLGRLLPGFVSQLFQAGIARP